MIIAIDGIVASGKSSIAKGLAARLGFRYLGAGSIYRSIALKLNNLGIAENQTEIIREVLENTKIEVFFSNGISKIYLDGKDVTSNINTPEISSITNKYASLTITRAFVKKIQYKLGLLGNIVMEGRDIGTVVFPNADLKLFLIASDEVRTKRRLADFAKQGQLFSFDEALKDILERDRLDSVRTISPLQKADDALVFDNSDYNLEQSLDILEKQIRQKFDL